MCAQLTDLYYKLMMSRHLDELVLILDTSWSVVMGKTQDCASATSSILMKLFHDFLAENSYLGKSFWKWRKINTTAQFHTIWKEDFQRCFDQWKTWWNKWVECKGESFNFPFIFIRDLFVLVNTVSVKILSDHAS